MEDALINRLRADRAFAGATVSAVAPCVDRDGGRAVGVNIEQRPREGSLARVGRDSVIVS